MKPKRLLFFSLLLIFQEMAFGQVQLPDVIGDKMVLQQGQKVPLWGKASPGELVRVEFKGQVHETQTSPDSSWKVFLYPLKASFEPANMTIQGKNKIVLEDILVGEVWFCSGQSNMQWEVQQSAGGKKAIAEANYPSIRLFNSSRAVAFNRKKGKLAEWKTCSPASVPDFSGVGYFFGRDLFQKLNVPIGLINSSYGGSQAEAWTPRSYLMANAELKPCIDREKIWEEERPQVQKAFDEAIKNWEREAKKARDAGKEPPRRPRVPDALRDYRIAASIYKGMVKPIIPFAVKGILWYQGESNEARAEQYELLLNTMIQSWRDQWKLPQLPFAIVQLPNFRSPSSRPEDKAWSHLRESQRQVALNDPYTDLITIIDLGEADDIHPTNKLDVGKRLSRWALAKVYDKKVLWSGPTLDSYRVEDGKIYLTFSNVGEGLKICKGKKLREFAISGEDKKWRWAKAKITGPNEVVLYSRRVPAPLHVRYAFNNNPDEANLADSDCLPAGPFRTDDFPGPTAGKR